MADGREGVDGMPERTWIALLRGVNVGGITIRSAELRELFDALGFADVLTVLASGNVRFTAAGERGTLKERIEAALEERFGYDAWIVLVTREELAAAVAGFPFDADDADRQPYVLFSSDPAAIDELAVAARDLDPDTDPVRASGEVLYWNPVKGTTLSTRFAAELARRRYRQVTTTRNLRTLRRLLG